MPGDSFRIGVMAPGSAIDEIVAGRVGEIAAAGPPGAGIPDGDDQESSTAGKRDRAPRLMARSQGRGGGRPATEGQRKNAGRTGRAVEIYFHPQCFLASGHFAGDDDARMAAFLDIANDDSFDALWFARGGYGSCRIAEAAIAQLTDAARRKHFLGYSDTGCLLAALYRAGFGGLAHGPMPSDILRPGGEAAVRRGLAWLTGRATGALEAGVSTETKTAAFNMAVLSQILGTPLEPDLTGHVLMLEETAEPMYRIDRFLFQITGNPGIRRVAGIRLGRCREIPPNEPDFGQTAGQATRHWCEVSGIPWLGRADIGHDIDNKVVPLGRLPPA